MMFLLKEAYSKSKGGSTYSVTCADLRLACTFLGFQLLKYFSVIVSAWHLYHTIFAGQW